VLLEELAAVGVAAAAAILEPVYRARGDAGRLFDALERRLGDARGADRAAILGEMVELRLAAGDVEGAWPLALARFAAAPPDLAALDAAFALADRLGAHESLADAIENALAERPDDRGLLGRLAALQEEVLGRGADACATWERA